MEKWLAAASGAGDAPSGPAGSATAVDAFSTYHSLWSSDAGTGPSAYRGLIPLAAPAEGEQYAFEVDLDRCSGCKACVTACHSLNGLGTGESWRSAGLVQDLRGRPRQQTITASCHHCLEPACAHGCPTLAYEKDAATGIVRHLDDQCFGCQYCLFTCPYGAPRYAPEAGIVRKCDMCHGRLAAGEAPACVQACPTAAIRITVVSRAEVKAGGGAGSALPDTPDPSRTLPTTRYRTARPLGPDMEAAERAWPRPERAHPALASMLLLTQAAAGAFGLRALWPAASPAGPGGLLQGYATCMLLLGLAASLAHLGRPWLAFRAVLGWRRSWLSREVLAFGAWAGAAGAFAWSAWARGPLGGAFWPVLTAALGAVAVGASAMVYIATPRPAWRTPATAARFLLCAASLGLAAGLALAGPAPALALGLAGAQLAKLAGEASGFRFIDQEEWSLRKRGAELLAGPLAPLWEARASLGVTCGILTPLVLALAGGGGAAGRFAAWIAALGVASGEVLERHLFFVAAAAPRMPGAE